jgi:hypothetical protein
MRMEKDAMVDSGYPYFISKPLLPPQPTILTSMGSWRRHYVPVALLVQEGLLEKGKLMMTRRTSLRRKRESTGRLSSIDHWHIHIPAKIDHIE